MLHEHQLKLTLASTINGMLTQWTSITRHLLNLKPKDRMASPDRLPRPMSTTSFQIQYQKVPGLWLLRRQPQLPILVQQASKTFPDYPPTCAAVSSHEHLPHIWPHASLEIRLQVDLVTIPSDSKTRGNQFLLDRLNVDSLTSETLLVINSRYVRNKFSLIRLLTHVLGCSRH